MDEKTLIWAAGCFETGGTIYLDKPGTKRGRLPVVRITLAASYNTAKAWAAIMGIREMGYRKGRLYVPARYHQRVLRMLLPYLMREDAAVALSIKEGRMKTKEEGKAAWSVWKELRKHDEQGSGGSQGVGTVRVPDVPGGGKRRSEPRGIV